MTERSTDDLVSEVEAILKRFVKAGEYTGEPLTKTVGQLTQLIGIPEWFAIYVVAEWTARHTTKRQRAMMRTIERRR